jgi:hypothetical protein
MALNVQLLIFDDLRLSTGWKRELKTNKNLPKKKINMYIDVGINVSCGGFYCSIIFSRVQRTYARVSV